MELRRPLTHRQVTQKYGPEGSGDRARPALAPQSDPTLFAQRRVLERTSAAGNWITSTVLFVHLWIKHLHALLCLHVFLNNAFLNALLRRDHPH